MKNNELSALIIKNYHAAAHDDSLMRVKERLARSVAERQSEAADIPRRRRIRPLAAAVCLLALFVTTAAAAPLIFRMIGSNIDFFENGETKYAPYYQEILEKYSARTDIAQSLEGFTFTVDNIAADANFVSLFCTVKSEDSIYEYVLNYLTSRGMISGGFELDRETALSIFIPVLRCSSGGEVFSYNSGESYYVSDNEIKFAQKLAATSDLPEIFELEIVCNPLFSADELYAPFRNLALYASIDRSSSAMKTFSVYPGKEFGYTALNDGEIMKRSAAVEKVAGSPLGNLIVFRSDGKFPLFGDYLVTDSGGNWLERLPGGTIYSVSDEETGAVRHADEIFGLSGKAEYIKLIPYTVREPGPDEYENGMPYGRVKRDSLPASVALTKTTDVVVKSIEAAGNRVKLTFSLEGVKGLAGLISFDLSFGRNADLSALGSRVTRPPVYDEEKDLFTAEIYLPGATADVDKALEGIVIYKKNIELLYDETVTIPLKR